jgi:type VI secretion system protein ImpG
MREELLAYYESELTFLRQMGAEFAGKYPKIASRLVLEPDRCEDPHTERLLEAFAFLAARVHLKIDDEFPEITSALLNVVYPHYLRPVPSMSVAEFHLDPDQGKLSTSLSIPRDSMLYSRAQVDGAGCKFRTCYETVLWPITVVEAQWTKPDRLQPVVKSQEAVGAIRLLVRCLPDVSFAKLDLERLRFYLNGESNLTHTLYELFCNNCFRILLRNPAARTTIPPVIMLPEALRPVGYEEEEAMLPYPRRSFAGYRLLQEYFTFHEKFLFFDLSGLEQLQAMGFDDLLEIIFLISPFEAAEREQVLEIGVSSSTFRLNCSPVVNLFSHTAEPILLDQTRHEYPVVPDVRKQFATEIFSVDSVVSANPRSGEVVEFQPFYSYRHAGMREKKQTFWHATRRSAGARDEARTDVCLSLVDVSGSPVEPDADAVTVRCTCTNSSLPLRLPFGSDSGDLELEGNSSIRKIILLRKPTSPLSPPAGKRAFWKLISHLSLNYLSLVEEGKDALQEILQLYNFSESAHLRSQISGITKVKSSRHFARVVSELGMTSARGTRVEIELDEEQFVGGGVYLFASVLERFLGMYVSMNSFNQLLATTLQRKEALKEWPPRAGRSILI